MLTTVFWTITALSFEAAGKRIGSLHLNLLRLGLAVIFLSVFSAIHRGMPFPIDASQHALIWLALSGIVGFVIGDFCLFQAFIITGARVSMLLMTLAPVFAALTGWVIMDEHLSLKGLLGMLLTLTGIGIVIFTRTPDKSGKPRKQSQIFRMSYPLKGILLALAASAGQGVGIVLSKFGMEGYDAFAASHIRVITGFVGFGILFSILGKWKELPASFKDRKAMKWLAVGSVFGPFLGVSFSLIAVQHTSAGIAQTIMSLVPVLILIPAVLINKEKLYIREVVGAVIAVSGVALFFL